MMNCRLASDCGSENNVVIFRNDTTTLEISFKRTIRVPDNETTYQLPPSLGSFPLVSVKGHEKSLPDDIVAKGGIFFPMYQREAMWINFHATYPFLIKVYVGGINAVSGRPAAHTIDQDFLRELRSVPNNNLQDYVVTPGQKWLDGIATSPGIIKQFVAVPRGSGFSVEAQMTGDDRVGGIQIEVTPIKSTFASAFEPKKPLQHIRIEEYSVYGESTINDLKCRIEEKHGIPPGEYTLIFQGRHLWDEHTLDDYKIKKGDSIYLVRRLRGGGGGDVHMAMASGGKIHQTIVEDKYSSSIWDMTNTTVLNIHPVDPHWYNFITGRPVPPTPITIETYKEAGLPFFTLYEEPSNISGDFKKVESVGSKLGIKDDHHDMKEVILNPSGPKMTFRTVEHLQAEMQKLKVSESS